MIFFHVLLAMSHVRDVVSDFLWNVSRHQEWEVQGRYFLPWADDTLVVDCNFQKVLDCDHFCLNGWKYFLLQLEEIIWPWLICLKVFVKHWSPSFCVVDTLTFLDKWDFNFERFWFWLLSPKLSFLFINIKLLKISPSFFFFLDWVSFDLHVSYELDFHFAHSFFAFRIVDTYNNFEVLI